MTDLDIQIDVPDDEGLDSSVRVLNGDSIPPWLKAAAVLVLGGLVALIIGAFILGRVREAEEEPLSAPTVATTPLVSAEASPAIESSLEAIQDWEQFARDGDLAAVTGSFDPDGPQYAMFAAAAAPTAGKEVEFAARNMIERTNGDVTTVSMDLVVSGLEGQELYPYDLVYINGTDLVWTVIDRRAPGTVALPPSPETIDAARRTWSLFTSSMAIGDGVGIAAVVGEDTRLLAEQVVSAVNGNGAAQTVLDDPELFDLLVARAERATIADPGQALIAILDEDQRQALVIGELTSWTLVDSGRVIASLEVAGQPVATVPFVATAEGWSFDFIGALQSSGGVGQ